MRYCLNAPPGEGTQLALELKRNADAVLKCVSRLRPTKTSDGRGRTPVKLVLQFGVLRPGFLRRYGFHLCYNLTVYWFSKDSRKVSMALENETTMSRASPPQLDFSSAARFLVDLIFPPCCGNCGKVDQRFCVECRRQLSNLPVTDACSQVSHLDAVAATGQHKGLLQQALQSFKYEGATELAALFADRLVARFRRTAWSCDVIVPVPLFADRLRERGYNQSLLLSQHMERELNAPCRPDSLARIRETSQQARLSQAERRANVQGAFAAANDVSRRSVLLVDDVVTTGSTLSECAVALRQKGAGAVYAISVSHA